MKLAVYGTPTVAGGSGEVLLMVRAALTGNVKGLLTVLLAESITVTVKPIAVVLEGVPVRTPPELTANPAGKPEADHE